MNFAFAFERATEKILKRDMSAYSGLNTALDEYTFLNDDGSLRTVFRYQGTTALAGSAEADDQRKAVFDRIKTGFDSGEHRWQVVFESDPEGVGRDLRSAFDWVDANAHQAGLNMTDLLTAQREFMAGMLHRENVWWVITTYPATLHNDVRKQAIKRRLEAQKELFVPLSMAQNPSLAIRELVLAHQSLVNILKDDLPSLGFHLQVLPVEKACRDMGACIAGAAVADDWAPHLIREDSDLAKMYRAAPRYFGDASNFLPPPLAYQISPTRAILEDVPGFANQKVLRIGDRYISSAHMHLGPENPQSFLFLLRYLRPIPWRISVDISPGGLNSLGMRGLMLKLLGFLKHNRPFKQAVDEIQERAAAGDPDCSVHITATTWAKDAGTLAEQHATLIREFQKWGSVQMTDFVGDEVQTYLSTVPGFSECRTGIAHAANLSDLLRIMPFARPTTPWQRSMMMFRSGDCKMLPYNTGTSEQKSWDDIIFAAMGRGKSVHMNNMLMFMAMSQGVGGTLPLILNIDIGWSSKGTIQMLKDRLSPDQKHLAQYFQMQNDPRYCINPFDLLPGTRYPNAMQKSTLAYLLQILFTPAGQQEMDRNAEGLAKALIDAAYDFCAKPATAKRYQPGNCLPVDHALQAIKGESPEDVRMTWYEVGDLMFEYGKMRECTLAYRYAVPMLADLTQMMQLEQIQDMYSRGDSKAYVNHGQELLVNSASRGISEALRDIPVLSGPTQLDIGDTRILSVNLDLVAKGDPRRAAIMYLLVRDIMARKAYITDETIDLVLPQYKNWMTRLYEENLKTLKVFAYDEFHRTKGIKALRELIKMDIREGRKWKIKTILVSHLLEDFDKEMLDLAANIWVLGVNDADEARALVNKFDLTEAVYDALLQSVTGPTPNGAPMLGVFKTQEGGHGKFTSVIYSSICPEIRWALTTDPDEVSLRTKVFEVLSSIDGTRMLARYYPRGAKDIIESARIRAAERTLERVDYIGELTAEILQKFKLLSN